MLSKGVPHVHEVPAVPPTHSKLLLPIRLGLVQSLSGAGQSANVGKSVYAHPLDFEAVQQTNTPGHTPGEVVLLDAANKILFTGNNDNSLVWLFLPTSRPLEVYLQSLKKLQQRSKEFDMLLPGHGQPLPANFLQDQILCVESILDRTCQSESYKSFAGNALLCKYKSAAVAFNPKNLRE